MGWRPGKPVPDGVVQAEGILVAAGEDGVHAWFPPDPAHEVPTIRVAAGVVSADGPLDELDAPDLDTALAAVGERLSPGPPAEIPPGWCSWSAYFGEVTEADVAENVGAARRLELPVEIVQVDDGWEACVGDWLDVSPRFGSVRDTAARIADAGMIPGIWTAPFLVGERSELARAHPDWLVAGADAGWNWQQRLLVLDVEQPGAREHLAHVYRTLVARGFRYHKLDFLYAGALVSLDAYRDGLRLIRESAGPDAILVGCGAPLLPSIGLVDAMRVGPDVLPEDPDATPDLAHAIRATRARSWMNGRLWVNDPDTLVVRAGLAEREAWAAHLARYGGLAFSGERLAGLDERGVELTRRVLARR
jgi:alpha-galactosidase